MDNTQAITLSDIADTYEFLENPLDVYENYTYNIEWFVVDRDSDQRFQEFGETLDVVTIVNDGWPTIRDTKITIAKTGVTTEFNLTDLSVQSVGAGIAETSKIAGTAITLDFTVTQVGETSLVDNLQNAIALCGWRTIDSTHFYIKINFVGVDKNGTKVKIPQTKIFTFTLQSVTQLSTETDIRGTSTVLQGTILPDTVISNKREISSTESGFDYEVAETLSDTLDNFIDELNESIKVTHPTLIENLQNTYKITMSKQFKEWIKDSSMKGVTSNTIKNMDVPDARHIGIVTPLMSIFKIIDDICINTKTIKDSLTRDTPGTTKVHKITPWLVPKRGGWNAVTGTMTYNVEFFMDYEKKIITQNMLDQANKTKNIQKTVKELFDEQHVNKIYHYLFTGKNDQILDFNITLDNELAKIYSAPTDWYAYENIMKAGTIEGDEVLKGFKEIVDASVEGNKELIEREMQSKSKLAVSENLLSQYNESLMADIKAAILDKMQVGMDLTGTRREQEVNKFIGNKSPDELMAELSLTDEYAEMMPLFAYALSNRDDWIEDVKIANEEWRHDNKRLQASNIKKDKLYGDFIASGAAVSGEYNWRNGVKQNAQKILSGIANKNPKNMILLEELDNDIISKMSNEDFENILKAQANNPIVYKRLISIISKDPSTVTIKPMDVEGVELARAKYYESKSNNVSMIHAQMSIKGDPHWLDGYMSPSLAKKEFDNAGAVTDKGYNAQTVINGANGLILKSGIADGTDLHDNVLRRNLITSLFIVKAVTSNFSGGIFTQALGMTKLAEAEAMSTVVPTVGPVLQETGDKNTNEQKEDKTITTEQKTIDPATILTEEFGGEGTDTELVEKITSVNEDILRANYAELLRVSRMYHAMKARGDRTGPGEDTISTAPKNWLHYNTKQYVEEQIVTTDNTIINQEHIADPPLNSDAAVRNVLANQTLVQLEKGLTQICKAEQKRGQIPFDACDTIKNINGKMLESFGLTIEDQGKASTITAMNTQINEWITNDGITFFDEEIAVYQIAAGGQLTIVGHDQDVVEKLVRKATGERTPVIILEEQASGIATEVVSGSHQNHAITNNRILNGSKPLNQMTVQGTAISTRKLQNYHNSDGSIKTEADIEAEAKAIQADTNCVGACRSAKYILLQGTGVDAAVARKVLDELQKNKVESIVREACPSEHANAFFSDSREFECAPILPNKLTDSELNDIEILKAEANEVFYNNYYTEAGIELEKDWKNNIDAVIEKDAVEQDLVISEDDKNALKLAAAVSINSKVALEELPDHEYERISRYETGINTIIADANDGHRGDLTTAVNIGKIQGELVTLSLKQDAINARTYYFEPGQRVVDAISLEELELDAAIKVLSLPAETMTEVATIITGGVTEFVPIDNPVEQIDVDKAPVLVKTALNTFDIILPGSLKDKIAGTGVGWEYAMANPDKVSQYNEALKIYKLITSYDYGDLTTVTDDIGNDVEVKDFNNVGAITYTDANGNSQTISNPSAFFGIYTTTYDDMNPSYMRDYDILRGKIADLFPDIESGQKSQLINGKVPRTKDGVLEITITGDRLYIVATP